MKQPPTKASPDDRGGEDHRADPDDHDGLSLSIFTVEADRKPLLAFAAKKHQEAEAVCLDQRVRTKLKSVRSGGVPVCDDYSILRVRLAKADERARYHERVTERSSFPAVFLIDVDEE
jgi:hypothetical protein